MAADEGVRDQTEIHFDAILWAASFKCHFLWGYCRENNSWKGRNLPRRFNTKHHLTTLFVNVAIKTIWSRWDDVGFIVTFPGRYNSKRKVNMFCSVNMCLPSYPYVPYVHSSGGNLSSVMNQVIENHILHRYNYRPITIWAYSHTVTSKICNNNACCNPCPS